jgi:AcrR family transcriptional regulator
MIDRRVQKTQQALHQALMDLIQERGYDKLTVKDIIERANVGRSTFYAHYDDKEQLLQAGLDSLGKYLLAQQRNHGAARFAFSHAIFAHAQGYRTVYRAMLGQHAGAVIADRMRKVLTGLVEREIGAHHGAARLPGVPLAAQVTVHVGAIMSVLSWWVDCAEHYSADELETILRRLTKLHPG